MNSLKIIMRLNAASCVSFGVLFLALPSVVGMFLGATPRVVISVVGGGLLVNGAHLIVASGRANMRETEVIWFSIGDFTWWLGTFGLIVANIWITSRVGICVAVVVAIGVGAMGVAQLWVLGLLKGGNTNKEHCAACVSSWMALPLWVKVWLVVLNGVFLAAATLLPDRVAVVVLVAYVATAPLLMGQIGFDGGLRRILGLVHLIVWAPLLAWLFVHADGAPYTTILTAVVAICLVFDINDVRLFLKGDRAVIGR